MGFAAIAPAEDGATTSRPGLGSTPPPADLELMTGTVRAVEESLLGRPETVEIVTPEVGTYPVEDEGVGEELKEHVGETVTVVAVIRLGADGRERLSVQKFRVHER
jgi:hypothetical protein